MEYGYIYKTTNLINNKVYIGQNKGKFTPKYFGSGKHFRLALKKYGKPNFKLEVIAYANSQEEIDELEKRYIAEYRKTFGIDNLYNISAGGKDYRIMFGKDNPFYGKHHTPETLAKIQRNRSSTKGSHRSIETIKKMSLTKLGKKCSEEHKKNIGKDRKDRIWINKDSKTKFIKEQELQQFLDLGWNMGRPINWNFKNRYYKALHH